MIRLTRAAPITCRAKKQIPVSYHLSVISVLAPAAFSRRRPRRARLVELLDLQIPELDAVALGLKADLAPRHPAVVELARDGTIDPERELLAAGGDLERVPL